MSSACSPVRSSAAFLKVGMPRRGTATKSDTALNPVTCVAIRSKLLTWYTKEHRKLAWRAMPGGVQRPDPYAVWVSEVMSQQTQISTVEKYFSVWMAEFATVQKLAEADLDRVNEVWSGLGYYRRARMLHQGANYVVAELGGTIPESIDQLLLIPGIGDYTAGAISSIAFGKSVPAIDGNVVRVVSRLATLEGDPTTSHAKKQHHALASSLLITNSDIEDFYPGDLNQSLMEFGAKICTPRKSKCVDCPVTSYCGTFLEARRIGMDPATLALDFPGKKAKTKQRDESLVTCVVAVRTNGSETSFLLQKRPETGLLAGLWEFPSLVIIEPLEEVQRQAKVEHHLGQLLGLRRVQTKPLGQVQHVFSHIRQTIWVYELLLDVCGPKVFSEQIRWTKHSDVGSAAISKQMRKVFDLYADTRSRKKRPRDRSNQV